MTADAELTPISGERPAPALAIPAEIPQTIRLVEGPPLTTWECGLGIGAGSAGATRCRNITPELMIELI